MEEQKKQAEITQEGVERMANEPLEDVLEQEISDETPSTTEPQDPLEEAMAQVEEFKVALQRERADFINFKKRVEREKQDARKTHMAETLMKVIPIMDDFDRAMEALPTEVKTNDWMTGFSLIHKKFRDLLDNMGIIQLNPVGEPFDPNFHEAVARADSDEFASGHVIEVLQKGYVIEDKCLRPAMVKVAN